jgi:hypothetical protein
MPSLIVVKPLSRKKKCKTEMMGFLPEGVITPTLILVIIVWV